MATAGLLPESDRASRAKARSEEDWKRCSGLFSRQRCTTRCRPGGAALTTYEIAGGSSCKTAVIVSADVDLANARLPQKTRAKAQSLASQARHRRSLGSQKNLRAIFRALTRALEGV
jgi:hypothetical protein